MVEMPFHPKDYQASPGLLAGRVILVTGAGTGLGRSLALACAAHGATLVLLGPVQRTLEKVYDEIEAAGGAQPALFVMDLLTAEAPNFGDLADTLALNLGRLDGLVHNAALLPYLSRIDDLEPESWQQVLKVNLTAPFLLTQACLPLLRQAPDASVIFTSDRVGRCGKAYWGAYGVSKFGLEGLSQILAEELRDTSAIRVNSLDPGALRTDLRARTYPGMDPDQWPLPEVAVPAFLYLLGPDSRGVTGQALDGQ